MNNDCPHFSRRLFPKILHKQDARKAPENSLPHRKSVETVKLETHPYFFRKKSKA